MCQCTPVTQSTSYANEQNNPIAWNHSLDFCECIGASSVAIEKSLSHAKFLISFLGAIFTIIHFNPVNFAQKNASSKWNDKNKFRFCVRLCECACETVCECVESSEKCDCEEAESSCVCTHFNGCNKTQCRPDYKTTR